jgi:hypothetical protein
VRLHFVRRAYDVKKVNPVVGKALGFLADLGSSSELDMSPIDCTRCLLYALECLDEAPLEFVRRYPEFWKTVGSISGEVLARFDHTHVRINPAEISERFEHAFADAPWDIKARIVAGFVEVVTRSAFKDEAFWRFTTKILKTCQDEVAQPGARACCACLAKLWLNIADRHGTDRYVRGQLVSSASPLLRLVLDFQLSDALKDWVLMLQLLKLPAIDPLQQETLDPQRAEVQKGLDDLATELSEYAYNLSQEWRVARLKKLLPEIMPYLHGFEKHGSRVRPPEGYGRATATLVGRGPKDGHEISFSVEAKVSDICTRSGGGFRLYIPTVVVTGNLNGSLRHPCERVVIQIPDGSLLAINRIDLTMIDDMDLPCSFNCQILRAWRARNGAGSEWALHAPVEQSETGDRWLSYVKGLPHIGGR